MSTRRATPQPGVWQRLVLNFIAGHPDRPLKPRALARELRIPDTDYTTFRHLVRQLLDAGTLVLGPGRTLRLPVQTGLIVGTFRAHRRGFGFVERPGQPGLYVARRQTGGARDGDTVSARITARRGRMPGPRAEVVRILERAPLVWVGVLETAGTSGVIRPQGRNAVPLVRIDEPATLGARPGDLVVVQPREETLDAAEPHGEIIERLGSADDARALTAGVIRRFAIPEQFPPDVQHAARRAAGRAAALESTGREDLRDLLTVTIDPPDARDYDDAASVELLPDANVRLGVHIADVAHFVQPDGVIDREARSRGTSVYFPGHVVPMLPEVLSTEVCSLQPGQDRVTKSVFLTYGRGAKVVDVRFANSVIRSSARLTYQQVTAALGGHAGDLDPAVLTLLRNARELAKRILRRRLKAGMISLVMPEVEIRVDEQGYVTDAGAAGVAFSNRIIEMFMVEANEAVSTALTRAGLRHLRRIHPEPEFAETTALAPLAPVLGHRVPKAVTRTTVRELLEDVRGKPEEAAVNMILLRALPQASYSPEDVGHFALACDDYCHFTSPIRRYPDLTTHRLLNLLIRSEGRGRRRARAGIALSDREWGELGRETSAAERRAQQAEREIQAQLLLLLMSEKVGQTFEGTVTGVASFGAFVQIAPFLAEGLVHIDDLGPDEWTYDRRGGVLVGRRSGKVVHVGLSLRVTVARADRARAEMVLVPAQRGVVGAAMRGKLTRGQSGGRRRGRR